MGGCFLGRSPAQLQQLQATGAAVLLDDARLECHCLLEAHGEPSLRIAVSGEEFGLKGNGLWQMFQVFATLTYIYTLTYAYICTYSNVIVKMHTYMCIVYNYKYIYIYI